MDFWFIITKNNFKEVKMSGIFDIFRKLEKEKSATPVEPVSFMVVGLGNPGEKYTFTRHNTGFLALDYISQKLGVQINRAKFDALYGEVMIGGKRVLLLKPQTFMNLSGRAVRQAADFYKIPVENIIVISDDVSLPVGRMRVRKSGSHGGQNGLKDIIYQLQSDGFPRLRIGIGEKPNTEYDLADWVLSKFTPDEQKILFEEFGVAMSGVEKIVSGDLDGAMMICNKKQ